MRKLLVVMGRSFRLYFFFSRTNYHHTPMRISSHLRHWHCTHRSIISLVIPVKPNFLKRNCQLWIADSFKRHSASKPLHIAAERLEPQKTQSLLSPKDPVKWVNPKIGVFSPPQIIHLFIGVFHYIHHPFWGTTIFGNTQMRKPEKSTGFESKFMYEETTQRNLSVLLQG